MRSTYFQRLSQVGAVLFLSAFTLLAWLGTGSLRAGEERTEGVPAVLVQPDEQDELLTDDPESPEPVTAVPADEPTAIEPVDPNALVPVSGSQLTVVGVEPDDALNFRTGPDPKAAVVLTRPASEPSEIVATGEVAETPAGGVWWEVTVDGQEGWANARFLSVTGSPKDVTADLVDDLPTLRYASPMEAALAVASTMTVADPASQVTVVNEPLVVGDGGVVFVDVIGVGDKSTDGYRLRIELLPVTGGDSGEVGAWVKAVEVTPLCRLGVGSDGLCV